ncbi:MAG: triose-phosphate isomerase [Campylobacterota bacterium]
MIFAANFKTNHTRKSTSAYLHQLDSFMQFRREGDEVYVFPPLTALDDFHTKSVRVGVQNAYGIKQGSVTGEVGLQQLDEFGVRTVLTGHSERRHLLGESQEMIAKKFAFFKKEGFTVIHCIGEPLDVRKNGDLQSYLKAQLEGIDLEYENLIVAYEPVWAIGTGESADNETISKTHGLIKQMIGDRSLLYGGSVKPHTAQGIAAIPEVDGVLVGGASLEVEDFQSIITACR